MDENILTNESREEECDSDLRTPNNIRNLNAKGSANLTGANRSETNLNSQTNGKKLKGNSSGSQKTNPITAKTAKDLSQIE